MRITVIATGFDQVEDEKVISGNFLRARAPKHAKPKAAPEPSTAHDVDVPRRAPARVAVGGGGSEEVLPPMGRFPERTVSRGPIAGLDIPTFIRRQMD